MTKAKKSPQQNLARLIQAGTSKPYMVCLSEARVILAGSGDEDDVLALECGDRLQDWVCSLPPGPHQQWRHLDEDDGHWWTQSRAFPYSNAVEWPKKPAPPRGPSADLVITDEIPELHGE